MTVRETASAPRLAFELVPGWEGLPEGWTHADVAAVATDRDDSVYLFCRGPSRIIVYDRDGRFLRSFGDGLFSARTHGITIAADGMLYCVDDAAHVLRKLTPEGELMMTIGVPGQASDSGYDGRDLLSITHGGPPFNRPTNVAVRDDGHMFVSDGYGNARVHRFDAQGNLLYSWGEHGTGPGQFMLPHGIAIDARGRVLVCDRENDRIQVFDEDGRFLELWDHVQRPTQAFVALSGRVYVTELAWWPGMRSQRRGSRDAYEPARFAVLDGDGSLLARYDGGQPGAAGNLCAPHGIAVDSRGDVYVAEVSGTFAVRPGLVAEGAPTFQKFRPRTAAAT